MPAEQERIDAAPVGSEPDHDPAGRPIPAAEPISAAEPIRAGEPLAAADPAEATPPSESASTSPVLAAEPPRTQNAQVAAAAAPVSTGQWGNGGPVDGDPPLQPVDHGIRPPGSCTPAQLRRFIKSRPWIPMHELRRRFAINGPDDEVTLVEIEGSYLFVGLPIREGQILGDLVRAGEVGYELSRDPSTPVIVGVYPMRPVPRI
jgi:hypothetical protein